MAKSFHNESPYNFSIAKLVFFSYSDFLYFITTSADDTLNQELSYDARGCYVI